MLEIKIFANSDLAVLEKGVNKFLEMAYRNSWTVQKITHRESGGGKTVIIILYQKLK